MALHLDPALGRAYVNRAIAYIEKRACDKAIADCNEAIRLDPSNWEAYFTRGNASVGIKDFEKALADYKVARSLDSNAVEPRLEAAWLLASCPKLTLRNGKQAVELAREACELSNWKDANCLAILAAAYAECRDFKEAVKWQKKAIEVGFESKKYQDGAREYLKLYEEGKPVPKE